MALQPAPAGGPEPAVPNPGAVFDPEAFRTSIMADIHKALNGAVAGLKKDLAKEPPANPEPAPAIPGTPEPEPPKAKTVADLELRVLQSERKQKELLDRVEASDKRRIEAEDQVKEKERVSQARKALEDVQWASPKARQLFEDANLPKVKWAEDGTLIVETDKGPLSYDAFLQAEAADSPYLLAPESLGGAGATGGKKSSPGPKVDILSMTTAQILALTPEQQTAILNDNLRLANS